MGVVATRRSRSPGEGSPCPANPEHGRLYAWEDGRWYCPSHAHGGNGRFFSDKEAQGEYERTDRERLDIPDGARGDELLLESAARDVIAEKTTIDKAVAELAKTSSMSTTAIRESLALMIKTITEEGVSVAEKRKQTSKKAAAAKATPKESGRRLEHVDAAKFQKVLKDTKLTNKQAAEATGAAGMGKSATYVYILLHQGASVNLFTKFKAALEEYAKNLPDEEEEED